LFFFFKNKHIELQIIPIIQESFWRSNHILFETHLYFLNSKVLPFK